MFVRRPVADVPAKLVAIRARGVTGKKIDIETPAGCTGDQGSDLIQHNGAHTAAQQVVVQYTDSQGWL